MAISIDTAQRVLSNSILDIIVLPTEKCNFRCTYCYEDFSVGRMSNEIVCGIKSLLSSRADGTCDLSMGWFGGEPLVAADIVLDIATHARTLWTMCGRHFNSHITTNAYLLKPGMFESLLGAGVRQYQITLDGTRDIHDSTRKRHDGRGSFDVIWNNLIAMERYARANPTEWFDVSLRIHYDSDSVFMHEPLIGDVIAHFGQSGRFAVNLHEIERLGGPGDDEIRPVDDAGRLQVARYARMLMDAGIRTVVAADVNGYICYASRANSFIVRADGRISKCTVALTDRRNDVGRILPNGTVEIANKSLLPWVRGLFSGDSHELACPRNGLDASEQQAPALIKLSGRGKNQDATQ